MSGLRQLRIGARLNLAFGIILAILAASAALAVWQLETLARTTHQLGTVDNERMQVAVRWRQTIDLNWVRTRAALNEADVGRIPAWQAEMDKTSETTTASRARLHELVRTETGKRVLAEIDAKREAYRGPRAALFKRKLAGEDVVAELERTLKPLAIVYSDSIGEMQDLQQSAYEAELALAEQRARTSETVLVVCGIVAVLLGALFAWLISRSITGPLAQAGGVARRIADGDLTERLQIEGRTRPRT